MNEIFVQNKNDFDHTDSFDGREYNFPKGEKRLVPLDAAAHMFGLGRADKTDNLVRLGWANQADGAQKLARFVFTQPVIVEQPIDDSTPPADDDGAVEAAA